MNYSSYRFTLDLHSTQSQTSIPAMLGDTGRTWHINLSDGGKIYFMEKGCLAKLSIKRPTGTYHEEFCEIRDNTTIVYPFTENVCAVVGLHSCEITLYGLDGKILGTPRFAMVVSDRVINDDDINLTDADHAILDEMVVAEANRRAAEYGRASAESERAARFDETVGDMNTRFDETVDGMNARFDETVDGMNARFDETIEDANQQLGKAVEDIKEEYKIPAIHIGPEAPEKGGDLWIDTDEMEEEDVDIDVTAKVGQVIAVKSVDADGKPTEFKAVDLPQPERPDWNAAEGKAGHVLNRTHYVDEKGVIHKLPNKFIDADWMATSEEHINDSVIIPEQAVTNIWKNRQMDIQPGITYDVYINDVVYPCVALNKDGGICLGNNTSLTLNDLPFCIFWAGGSATSGFFYYNSDVLSGKIYMKVMGHSYTVYNKLPEKFLPGGVVKTVNGNAPDENGNVEIETGGGASIDVVAEVGQTIIVKEVDENGKPTKWESADYQPRTHWREDAVILPETTVEIDPDAGIGLIPVDFTVEGGEKYTVKYNGVEYAVECTAVEGGKFMGNAGAVIEGLPVTTDPFALAYGAIESDDEGNEIFGWAIVPLDGSASVTLSIAEPVYHTIPQAYLPKTCVIDADATDTTGTAVQLNGVDTTDIMNAIFNDAPIYVNLYMYNETDNSYPVETLLASTYFFASKSDYNDYRYAPKKYYKELVQSGVPISSIPCQLHVYSLVYNKTYQIVINFGED